MLGEKATKKESERDGESAVDNEDMSIHVGRTRRRQEYGSAADFVGTRPSSQWIAAHHNRPFYRIGGELGIGLCGERAGRYSVAGNAAGSVLHSKSPYHAAQTLLGDGINGIAQPG